MIYIRVILWTCFWETAAAQWLLWKELMTQADLGFCVAMALAQFPHPLSCRLNMSRGRTISGLISGLFFFVFLGISLTIWLQFNNKPLCKLTDIRLWLLLFVFFCFLNKVLKCFKCMTYGKYCILNPKGAKYKLNNIISVHNTLFSFYNQFYTLEHIAALTYSLSVTKCWDFLGKRGRAGKFPNVMISQAIISSCHGTWAANHSARRGRHIRFWD